MSLVAWFPLNGDLNNYGCSDYTLTNSNATVSTDGKIGKCYSFNGTNSFLTSNFSYQNFGNNVSIAFWVKIPSFTSDNQLLWGRYQNGPFIDIAGQNIRCYLWAKNADGTVGTAKSFTFDFSSYINTWIHVCFTFNGTTGILYLNGELKKSDNWNCNVFYSSGACQIGRWNNEARWLKGLANDFRIYNHCLSQKEVHEISKGLVVHYKLDSEYQTGNLNFYTGEETKGKASGYFTITELTNETGYNFKRTYTGTGTSAWLNCMYSSFPYTKLKNNTKYIASMKVRVNKCTSGNLAARLCVAGNTPFASANVVETTKVGKGWIEYVFGGIVIDGMTVSSKTWYVTKAAADAAGSTNLVKLNIEFKNNGWATKDQVYDYDFDVKDVQIIEADEFPGYIDNTFASDYVVDNSGFLNNAQIVNSLKISSNSPVYDKAIDFAQQGYLKRSTFDVKFDKLTISYWVYARDTTGKTQHFLLGTMSDWAPLTNGFGFWRDIGANYWAMVLRSSAETTHSSFGGNGISSVELNTWNHFVITYSGTQIKVYVNGVLKNTKSYGSNGYCYCPNLYLGNSTFQSTPASETEDCMMSDFRLYATALTDADVEELYKIGASIDKTGNTFTNQFVEKSDIANVKINKNKQIYVKELQEENLTGTAKTKIYKTDKMIKTVQFIEH